MNDKINNNLTYAKKILYYTFSTSLSEDLFAIRMFLITYAPTIVPKIGNVDIAIATGKKETFTYYFLIHNALRNAIVDEGLPHNNNQYNNHLINEERTTDSIVKNNPFTYKPTDRLLKMANSRPKQINPNKINYKIQHRHNTRNSGQTTFFAHGNQGKAANNPDNNQNNGPK